MCICIKSPGDSGRPPPSPRELVPGSAAACPSHLLWQVAPPEFPKGTQLSPCRQGKQSLTPYQRFALQRCRISFLTPRVSSSSNINTPTCFQPFPGMSPISTHTIPAPHLSVVLVKHSSVVGITLPASQDHNADQRIRTSRVHFTTWSVILKTQQ